MGINGRMKSENAKKGIKCKSDAVNVTADNEIGEDDAK